MYSLEDSGPAVVYRDAVEDVTITAPRDGCLGLVRVQDPPVLSRPDFTAAFARPVGTPPLRQLARGAKRVAVIVSDATRGVPTAAVMPMIMEDLAAAGIGSRAVTVVIATGVHRPANESEIAAILGRDWAGGLRVVSHDAHDADGLVFLGETARGTPLSVNRTVLDADLRIVVGKVEPHEFAGFSGGRKSVLPGVSGEAAIRANHRPEMLMAPQACPGQLDGNPIHLDMLEAASMVGITFAVNLVLNQAGAAVGLFAGGLEASHQAAVAFMRSFCQVVLKQRPDIVVTTPGQPLNIDFYQSVKPAIALAPVMPSGGIIVLYAGCRDGLGTADMLIPYEGAGDVGAVIERLQSDYRIQMDHALLLGKILLQGVGIVVATPSVDPAVLHKMFLSSAASPQEALETALAKVGKPKPSVLFFPQAQRALSVLDSSLVELADSFKRSKKSHGKVQDY